jgi:low affinity Fe/Cu permease
MFPWSESLSRFSEKSARWTGGNVAFCLATASVIVWLLTGPVFHFSDTWQLVMNTVTNVVTYLMVFLIQRSQNKDSVAVHMKLNEIVAAIDGASNRLISAENLTERELATLSAYYNKLTTMAAADDDLTKSHSIEDAEKHHTFKRERRRAARPPSPEEVVNPG